MSLLRWISLIIFILLGAVLALGFIPSRQTIIQQETTIEAPQTVVFNYLKDFESYKSWAGSIEAGSYTVQHNQRRVTYLLNGRQIPVTEKIEIIPARNAITFTQISPATGSLLHGFEQQVLVSPLPDGSTQVNWELRYSVSSVIANFYNLLFMKSSFSELVQSWLKDLKTAVERT